MAMICPQCGKAYEQRLQCQLCGVRLLYQDHGRQRRDGPGRRVRWRQTPWGRVLIGLALSQGLFYGLRQLLTGALMALQSDGSPEQIWGTPAGLVLLQVLRLLTLVIGAILAGGGQRYGAALGAVVGLGNGVLSVFLQPGPVPVRTAIEMYGQPLLQTVFGALGGWVGCAFWQPVPIVDPNAHRLARKRATRRARSLFAGPVAWVRVCMGVALAVAGTLSAAVLLDLALEASRGTLSTTDAMQDQMVTWEIKALALLLGGALAGATTANGGKQGLAVGIGSSIILIGIRLHQAHYWLEVAALTLVSSFSLTFVGGCFGSQLFPPVVKFRRPRDLGPTA